MAGSCQQAAVLSFGDPAPAGSQAAHGDVSAGHLAFQSCLTPEPSSPLAGRELLFLCSIWLSPEPALFWPWHFFPLLCSSVYQDRMRQVDLVCITRKAALHHHPWLECCGTLYLPAQPELPFPAPIARAEQLCTCK